MKKREPEKMLSVKEVAIRLNRPAPTVRLWVKQGRFKNAKLESSVAGSFWLIPESDLSQFTEPERGRPLKLESELKHKRRKAI
jgi:excisionase family DNA binding protein